MKLSSIILIFLVVFISGCCLKFSDLTPGTTYNVGNIITTSSTEVAVEQFQWANGNWTSTGSSKVDTRNYAKGSGMDINANNVNLRFLFDYPIREVKLKIGELGGNNNIKVNGDFRNVANFIDINGATIGDALVTVNVNQQGNNWYGDIIVEGEINDFSIGGQELWIDDVCTKK